ncbi:MAG: hypothetical protein V1856_03250 [Candidatus Liptonbacteria bacterium]
MFRTRLKIVVAILIGTLCVAGSIVYVYAAQYYRINSGSYAQINEHGVCRKVSNDTTGDRMIPTNTAGEWSDFRSKKSDLWASFTAAYTCNTCSPMWVGKYILQGGSCYLFRRDSLLAGDWDFPNQCADRCYSLGGTACGFMAGGDTEGCYTYKGTGCYYGSHGSWYASFCNQ